MKTRLLTPVVLLLLAAPSLAGAQTTTGSITGRVTDTQGFSLPGAAISVTGAQGVRTLAADIDGRFTIPLLVPGRYSIQAEYEGFKTAEAHHVMVTLGQTTTLDLRMEMGEISETVAVSVPTTLLDVASTTTGAVLEAEAISRVPLGRLVTDALALAPGISATTTGDANPSFSGATGLDNLYVIDGVNVTNAGYGAVGSYSIVFGSLGAGLPLDFTKEIQVKTGGYEAEFGQSQGGIMSVVTKSGTNQVRGSAFGYTRPSALQAEWRQAQTLNGAVNTTAFEQHDIGVEAGGPMMPDRAFAFAALNPSWETQTFIAPEDAAVFPLRELGEIPRERRRIAYAAKATWQAATGHRLEGSVFGDPANGSNGPQRANALLGRDTARFSSLRYGGHSQTGRYDGLLSNTWFIEASVSRSSNKVEETPSGDEWSVADLRTTPIRRSGGIGFYESATRGANRQLSVKSTHTAGGHQFKYGLLYENVHYTQADNYTGPTFVAPNGEQTATGANIEIRTDPALGTIWRVVRANFNVERPTTQTYWALFAQDSVRVTDRLTVNAGIRYEAQDLRGTIDELVTLGGEIRESLALRGNWAARVGAIYDVIGEGRSKLYGSYGRYHARIPNDLAARALSADAGIALADYRDAGLTRPVSREIGPHFQLSGAFPNLIDEEARLSYKDELAAGFEWEALAHTSIGVRYVHRGIGGILEDLAPLPAVGYFLGHPDLEHVQYVLTNPGASFETLAPELAALFEDPTHTYDALEIMADRRFADNWQVSASYRWSRLHGTFEGFFREDNGQSDPGITSLYDFPTDDPSFVEIGVPQFGFRGDIRYLGALGAGPLPLDRPHTLNLWGSYTFAEGAAVGTRVRLNSGRPLTPLAANPVYNTPGEIPEGVRGSGFETVDGFLTRTPLEGQVDVQASYALNLATGRLTLIAEAFNLLNSRRTLSYNSFTELSAGSPNPDFGQPGLGGGVAPQFQAPFQLRVGARLSF